MIIIGLLGESGVGKTHIIHRYISNDYPQKLASTIAVEFSLTTFELDDGNTVKLKIWDTSGQDKYK